MAISDPRHDAAPAEPSLFDAPMFVATESFVTAWADADLTDADLTRLYTVLAANPRAGTVMGGTGGLRKVRFAPEGRGKSGGVRVCYASFAVVGGVVLLFTVFSKSEKTNLSREEKNDAAQWLAEFETALTEFADEHPAVRVFPR